MLQSKYVIIGACAAGMGALEAIREVDPIGAITVISDEQCPHYSRPAISDYVCGKTTLEKMKTRDDAFLRKNSVHAYMGKKAVSLNTVEGFVDLDSGERVAYDKLLIATGGKPFVPKIEGSDRAGVFTFTAFSDAERIGQMITAVSARSAVVIGGGLIGVSVTEALVKRGLRVTVVELQDKILSLLLDSQASNIVVNAMTKAGVQIIAGQSVEKITGKTDDDNAVGGVVLTGGNRVPCDLVVVAIGVVPRTELAVGTEIKTNRGIVVDSTMQTSVPNVYASGDVAEAYDFVLDQNRLLPLWPLAVSEGKVAGYNMAGKHTDYAGGTNMSTLKYFGVPIVSVGLANPKEDPALEILVKHEAEKGLYKKIVLRDNIIVGLTLVIEIERAGILFYLMRSKVNVKRFKQSLLSDDFGLAMLPASVRNKMNIGE